MSQLDQLRNEVGSNKHQTVQKMLEKLFLLDGDLVITDEDSYEIWLYMDVENDEYRISAWIEGYGEDYFYLDDDLILSYAIPKIIGALKSAEWIEL
jgi:hypothetical protein